MCSTQAAEILIYQVGLITLSLATYRLLWTQVNSRAANTTVGQPEVRKLTD